MLEVYWLFFFFFFGGGGEEKGWKGRLGGEKAYIIGIYFSCVQMREVERKGLDLSFEVCAPSVVESGLICYYLYS